MVHRLRCNDVTLEDLIMHRNRLLTRPAVPALLALTLLAGCARLSPVEPELASRPATVVADESAPPPPSRLYAPTPGGSGSDLVGGVVAQVWDTICIRLVLPGFFEEVRASRYELKFQKGSLLSSILCTIKEYDPDVIDVQFGPHGTEFKEPVTLSIDFSGTAADPKSEIADGCEPVLWWWNEARGRWEVVPGTTDWKNLRHVVRLEHFSRYVLGGKAGWKHQPLTETD